MLDRCIVGKDVRILNGSVLGEGCLLADGVTVGPDAQLPPFTRVSRKKGSTPIAKPPADDEDEDVVDDDDDSEIDEVEAGKQT